jgi:hypothetical protein
MSGFCDQRGEEQAPAGCRAVQSRRRLRCREACSLGRHPARIRACEVMSAPPAGVRPVRTTLPPSPPAGRRPEPLCAAALATKRDAPGTPDGEARCQRGRPRLTTRVTHDVCIARSGSVGTAGLPAPPATAVLPGVKLRPATWAARTEDSHVCVSSGARIVYCRTTCSGTFLPGATRRFLSASTLNRASAGARRLPVRRVIVLAAAGLQSTRDLKASADPTQMRRRPQLERYSPGRELATSPPARRAPRDASARSALAAVTAHPQRSADISPD